MCAYYLFVCDIRQVIRYLIFYFCLDHATTTHTCSTNSTNTSYTSSTTRYTPCATHSLHLLHLHTLRYILHSKVSYTLLSSSLNILLLASRLLSVFLLLLTFLHFFLFWYCMYVAICCFYSSDTETQGSRQYYRYDTS